MRLSRFRLLLVPIVALTATAAARVAVWGDHGHRITGQAAAAALPAEMPAFFRDAGPQLSYLNPEPDRWRERAERDLDPALDAGTAPEHFIDIELIPAARLAGALAAPGRLAYADTLRAAGVDAANVGLLPYRILELTQSLRVQFRLWRSAPNAQVRAWIEQRIINDAGILGHYVADGSNPAHTSIHFNGWSGPNPNGYATDRRFHSRFESAYVQTHIRLDDVAPVVNRSPRVLRDLRGEIVAYLKRSHAEVEPLYALDKQAPFDTATTAPENKRFAVTRLAAGAEMLRDLWWTAYATSAPEVRKEP